MPQSRYEPARLGAQPSFGADPNRDATSVEPVTVGDDCDARTDLVGMLGG